MTHSLFPATSTPVASIETTTKTARPMHMTATVGSATGACGVMGTDREEDTVGSPGWGSRPDRTLCAGPRAARSRIWHLLSSVCGRGLRMLVFLATLCLMRAGTPHPVAAGTATPAGNAWAWGWNISGQLGSGTTTDSATPRPVHGVQEVRALANGLFHSMALRANGTVWTWGGNDFGQLGIGTTADSITSARVPGLHTIVAIAAGPLHSLALQVDGTVWAWGANSGGQLGAGPLCTRAAPATCLRTLPLRVPGLPPVVAIAAGVEHSLALTREGVVWTWGWTAEGVLGTGVACDQALDAGCASARPAPVDGLPPIVAIATGALHSLALDRSGHVWAWGANEGGQLGRDPLTTIRGRMLCSARPLLVAGLGRMVAIATGDMHSLALDRQGQVWAWGANAYGQLGLGATADSSTPRRTAINNVVTIAGGRRWSLALDATGRVWTWGWDLVGALAPVAHEGPTTPEQVPGLSHVIALASGSSANHAVVIVAP